MSFAKKSLLKSMLNYDKDLIKSFGNCRRSEIDGPALNAVNFIRTSIYIFIAIALDESIFLDVLHFPMKNIKSRDLEATPMGGATSKPIQ